MTTSDRPDPSSRPSLAAYARQLSDRELLGMYNAKLQELERLHHELSARFDASIPGADTNQHHADHQDIYDRRVNDKKLWADVRSRILAGVILALVGVVVFLLAINGVRLIK